MIYVIHLATYTIISQDYIQEIMLRGQKCSVSYELLAGINYRQIIGMRIQDSIHENPTVCGKFHVVH